jgi:pyruvate formate lyase activating enzyme
MQDEAHKELTGHSNGHILAFAKYLDEIGKPVWIRHVVVPGITFVEEELTALGEFLKTLSNVEKLEVLPYHSLGQVKYENLGMEYVLKDVPQLTKAEGKEAERIIRKAWGVYPVDWDEKEKEDKTGEKKGDSICRPC